jgi:hypothetical protein
MDRKGGGDAQEEIEEEQHQPRSQIGASQLLSVFESLKSSTVAIFSPLASKGSWHTLLTLPSLPVVHWLTLSHI